MKRRWLTLIVALIILQSCNHRKIRKSDYDDMYQIINQGTYYVHGEVAKQCYERALKSIQDNDLINAKKYMMAANEANQNNPSILTDLGNLIGFTETPKASYEYYKKAIQLDSTFTRPYINYSVMLYRDSQYQDAMSMLYKALSFTKVNSLDSHLIYCNLAGDYLNLHDTDKALILLDSALIGLERGSLYGRITEERMRISADRSN